MARASFLLAIVLLAPLASAAVPVVGETAPALGLTLDTTAYRAEVDKAVQWSLGFQKADGGVYEYTFLQKDTNAAAALQLYANAQTLDVRGPQMQALVGYFESSQTVGGSWGSGYLVPQVTADVIEGLLDAGYDKNSTVLKRALLYVEVNQNLAGYWSDGAGSDSTTLTSENVANLLAVGVPRGDDRIQRALEWILPLQEADGGMPPTPGWFTTPAASALVLKGLDAYLLAPASPGERVTPAQVEAAARGVLSYLGATWDAQTGQWQASTGANALIVGPAAHFFAARGEAIPAWLAGGAKHLASKQNADGAIVSWNGSPMLDYTLIGARSLLEMPRALRAGDAVGIQTTWNHKGEYGSAQVSVTIIDAAGVVRGAYSGPAGIATLSWSNLPAGPATVRVETAGAAPVQTTLWR